MASLGVQAITGLLGRLTTQGKNEHFHQVLFKWLGKQPNVQRLDQLQEFVDRFDLIRNLQHPHQALLGRTTPQQSWDATAQIVAAYAEQVDDAISNSDAVTRTEH
ncbi:hypothetical protein ACTXJU_09920 [Glutamicibacter ardleyensis]|uniref:hypothetical protein n=1 Tax=Glutamicibacter ardleyensis TaxID=225894 RepID=UPI003F9CD105